MRYWLSKANNNDSYTIIAFIFYYNVSRVLQNALVIRKKSFKTK